MSFSVSEIALVGLVALVVIKPEQLPEVAFTLGRLTKSLRGLFNNVKQELNGLTKDEENP